MYQTYIHHHTSYMHIYRHTHTYIIIHTCILSSLSLISSQIIHTIYHLWWLCGCMLMILHTAYIHINHHTSCLLYNFFFEESVMNIFIIILFIHICILHLFFNKRAGTVYMMESNNRRKWRFAKPYILLHHHKSYISNNFIKRM